MSFSEHFESISIPIKYIKLATGNFADENLLKESSSSKVYKGILLQSGNFINIVARRYKEDEITMKEVVYSLGIPTHKNIGSVFKISEETKGKLIIINKYEVNGSLKDHLSGPALTWIRRLHICVGVANALKYLHNDLNEIQMIHSNIKISKILLDHNWEPKIYGFGYALSVEKHRIHFTREYNVTLQYRDPAYENSGGLTHKSDVFSFGVLLFEVLFGREASIQDNDNWYFARLARSHYEDKKLVDLIDPDLHKQMNLQSLELFAETAYCCLKEQRIQRADMIQVLSKLEKALELQHKFENPEATSSSNHLQGESFDHLKFRLHDIELATNNFSDKYRIGSGGYGVVYKAELKHLNEINSLAIQEKTKAKISNKVSTVAIKRIFSRNDVQGEQGFFSEIEMLSNCKHPNIVSLQGFCDEGEEMILVYEYVSNGSLSDYLEDSGKMTTLTWAQRMQICLDIAHGLEYLHTSTQDKQCIIHRDIKSANILLDHKWVAKIADFGLSKLHPANQKGKSTLVTKNIAGTEVYLDPEYLSTGKLKAKSDVYSFGVVLFEIMCGKLAYDNTYGQKRLPTIARERFNEGTLKLLIDPKIIEADENISMLIGGVDQESFDTFTKVAYKCIEETQLERPTIEVVIKELEKALNFQINNKERLSISLKAIKLGTQNFNDSRCIGEGRFWKLFEGEVVDDNGRTPIMAKRWDRKSGHGRFQLSKELDILLEYKHKNIIGLVGYCIEMGENIILYEHAPNGRLDKHMSDRSLTWMQRLKICVDIVSGLEFLHKGGVDQNVSIIHRDIKSSSILLDGNWNAKITNFEFSWNDTREIERAKHVDDNACDSLGYIDPRYKIDGFLTKFSDLYSFGVILVEMLCGRLAWAKGFEDHSQSLGYLAARHYEERKNLDELIFEGIKKQIVTQSLTEFVDIAIECLKDKRSDHLFSERASYVVEHVTKALVFQKSADDNDLHISLEAIKLGTRNFSDLNCIGEGRIWKLYEGEIADAKGCTTIVAKRWDTKSQQEHIQEFQTELHTLLNYKHKNIIRLVGYYDMMDENIIVYEHVHNGRLDKHLADPGLTWMKRLKICLDVAKGMEFFHKGAFESLKHRDIKSGSILLDGDWNAKISNFELSRKTPKTDEDSDMYAFGVILIEMLCGRSAWGEECKDQSQSLGPLAVEHYNEKGSFDEMIFGGIKHQISPRSLTKYESIALGCLGVLTCLRDVDKYDSIYAYARRLVIDLEEALKFQEDHETWEPRLPMDYKEIIQASIPPLDDSEHMKQDIYALLSKGVLLQGGKILFSLGSNGERSELISAKMFSYKNRKSRKWLSVEESRFQKAVQMLDISKLKIKIKIRTQLLSPSVNYGAYLIFKFSDSKKFSSNPMYVNLKYKMGGANLHAYFATWRDDKWMEIELHRFFSHRKDRDFEVQIESFSRYHCGNGSIYVEGIEFRVIDNVQNKHIEQVQQLLKSDSNMKFEHFLTQREVNEKKHHMLQATKVLYDSSNVKHFQLHPSADSRFQEVAELLPQHLFRINCKINRHQMLSQNTEYMCYLVFKLSEKCVGLHCPVRVRDLRNRNNKKAEIVYFRSPRPWNLHGNNIVSKQREDGWMEVKVWKFNSYDQLRNGSVPVNLKLIAYEGTMSGLIICGMEFRPYCMWRGHCIESTIYKQM